LIYGRCRDEEVSLDIRFGWRNTESEDVPGDERKVLPLTAGGPSAVVEPFPHRVAGAASQGGDEAALKQLDGEDGVLMVAILYASPVVPGPNALDNPRRLSNAKPLSG
jgi:hypothetical protein